MKNANKALVQGPQILLGSRLVVKESQRLSVATIGSSLGEVQLNICCLRSFSFHKWCLFVTVTEKRSKVIMESMLELNEIESKMSPLLHL